MARGSESCSRRRSRPRSRWRASHRGGRSAARPSRVPGRRDRPPGSRCETRSRSSPSTAASIAAVAGDERDRVSVRQPRGLLVFPPPAGPGCASAAAGATLAIAIAVGFAVLEHDSLPRAIRVRLDHAQRPPRPKPTSPWRFCDAVASRAGIRAQAIRRATRRVPRPAQSTHPTPNDDASSTDTSTTAPSSASPRWP